MGFKSRNQMLMEQHYQNESIVEEMKTVLYELILESEMDIDDVRQTFYDTYEDHDRSLLESVWDEVLHTMSELN